MSKELITSVILPILLGFLAASVPPIISWLLSRRKAKVDADHVVVTSATAAVNNLIGPLNARIDELEAEMITAKRQIRELQHENTILKARVRDLEQENNRLREENCNLRGGQITPPSDQK